MAMNNWWSDPLPPGWESKWDPGMNRYFFIDHTTKKTSWTDPRSPEGRRQLFQASPQQPRAQNYPMQAMNTVACGRCRIVQVPRSPAGQLCASCKAKTVDVKCNLCSKQKVKKQGDVCPQCMLRFVLDHQETSFNEAEVVEPTSPIVRADQTLLSKLQTSFPKAMESHIRAALESTNNNEAAACANLEKRGYKKVSALELNTDKLLIKLRPQYGGCNEELLRTTITSCDADETKTMKKMKELGFLTPAEKQQQERQEREAKAKREAVERNIRRDFPDVSSDLITLALESADYNEKKAVAVLKSMTSVEKKPAPTIVQAPAQPVASTSSSRPSTSTSSVKAVAAPAKPIPAPTKLIPAKLRVNATKAEKQKKSPSKSACKQQKVAPVSYTSKLARGPDPSLPKGGQDNLLLKSYCDIVGPNPKIVLGPSCRVVGSQGAIGPDASLVHGPMHTPRLGTVV